MSAGRLLMGLALLVAPAAIVAGVVTGDIFLEILLLFVAIVLFELGRSRRAR